MLKDAIPQTVPKGTCAVWTAAHVAKLHTTDVPRIPVIGADDLLPGLPGLDIWDMWPLNLRDGSTAAIAGGVLWFALAAPIQPDPILRHGFARIRLLWQVGSAWFDCGNALPDGFAPGSRDWSGSAIYDFITRDVTLFFTAAGRRGEDKLTVEQRLFQTTGTLDLSAKLPAIRNWVTPREMVVSDDDNYMLVNQAEGLPGKLKAFRDPAYFRDPADGRHYIVFAASLKNSPHEANGAVGIARALNDALTEWELLPPLLSADGINNELERPQLVYARGMYYLFWSTQAHVFAQGLKPGPTGMYGMAAPSLFGHYEPLNGSGLVVANPQAEPLQAYSWCVLGDFSVTSFVDYWGMAGRTLEAHPELLRSQFGGVPAPFFKIRVEGTNAYLVTR